MKYLLVTWPTPLEMGYAIQTIYKVEDNRYTPIYFKTLVSEQLTGKFLPAGRWPNNSFSWHEIKTNSKVKEKRWLTKEEMFEICL